MNQVKKVADSLARQTTRAILVVDSSVVGREIISPVVPLEPVRPIDLSRLLSRNTPGLRYIFEIFFWIVVAKIFCKSFFGEIF